MTDDVVGIDAEIRVLVGAFQPLLPRAKAAIFAACTRALSPLLRDVEKAYQGRWSFPDLDPALNIVEEFATGVSETGDYSQIRARIMSSMPHSDDLGYPQNSYVQDTLICVDGGLVAASTGIEVNPRWIQYALAPLMAAMEVRDLDVIRTYGQKYWSIAICKDPTLSRALQFLHESIAGLRGEVVAREQYCSMVEKAAILRQVKL